MKTIVKNTIVKLPKAEFVKEESLTFLKDIDLFSKKKAMAKEMLKGTKLPSR